MVKFENGSIGKVASLQWHFEGGRPSQSTEATQLVRYEKAGRYDVTLIIEASGQFDTLVGKECIIVEARDEEVRSWWNDAVFYQIFVRSFKDSDGDGIGDFAGIEQMLDYLNDGDPSTTSDLGIDGITLMPIHPALTYHGYEPLDHRAIHEDYGTLDEFSSLIDACHARGIRVILDLVMNHTSDEHPWFEEAVSSESDPRRDWYRWEDDNPNQLNRYGSNTWHFRGTQHYYGYIWSGAPDLNYREPAVKDEMLSVANYWLQQGVDGFRLNDAEIIYEEGELLTHTTSTLQFWEELSTLASQAGDDIVLIGDIFGGTDVQVQYAENDRLSFSFHQDLADVVTSSVLIGDARPIADLQRKIYNRNTHLQQGTLISDQDRNRIRTSLNEDDAQCKMAARIYLTLPGTPFIYYGEEIGMLGDTTSNDLFVRRPMQWTGGDAAGFTTGAPWTIIPDATGYNVAIQETQPESILNEYKRLIQLRRDHSLLREGHYSPVLSDQSGLLAYVVSPDDLTPEADTQYLVLHNLGNTDLSDLAVNLSFTNTTTGFYAVTDIVSGVSSVEYVNQNFLSGFEVNTQDMRIFMLAPVAVSVPKIPTREAVIFPNPVSHQLSVTLHDEALTQLPYTILMATGQEVIGGLFRVGERLDVAALPPGFYYLHMRGEDVVHLATFVVE